MARPSISHRPSPALCADASLEFVTGELDPSGMKRSASKELKLNEIVSNRRIAMQNAPLQSCA